MKHRHLTYLCLQKTEQGQASHAHVHEIINGLRGRGWKVTLIEPQERRRSLLTHALGLLTTQLRLLKVLPTTTVLYVRAHPLCILGVIAARAFGVPVVQEVNGPSDDIFFAYPQLRRARNAVAAVYRASLQGAKAYITHSGALAGWVRTQVPGASIHLVPNGANTTIFHPNVVRRSGLPNAYAVFFGAMAPWQGIDTILEALQHPEWPRDLSVVFMGDGPERAKITQAAAQDSRIVDLGTVPYADVPTVAAGAVFGLCVKNYRAEHGAGVSPLKLYETLACGVPIIVTNIEGQVEVVSSHRCGWIIERNDSAGLAKLAAHIHANEDEAKRRGAKGCDVVRNEHSWEARAADVDAVLHMSGCASLVASS
jgi:glycosyltransferase involved in cell wall biosynthesis